MLFARPSSCDTYLHTRTDRQSNPWFRLRNWQRLKFWTLADAWYWVTRFGPKMGQIGPKWDKSGTFSDQISVHFGAAPKCTEI